MAAPEEETQLPGKCRDWKALLGPGVIVVDVWATFPSAGWNMELRRAEQQGDDPEQLTLERVVTFPEGYQPPVVRGIDVHWEEQTDVEYKTVRIVPDDLTLEVLDRRNAPPLNADKA
ncbi:MAG: hypothetical protein Q8O56_10640 [Solirubrobacteraceae bacterium]|nr:hypothetical protein [Solirubrobacteraceae bacterium]